MPPSLSPHPQPLQASYALFLLRAFPTLCFHQGSLSPFCPKTGKLLFIFKAQTKCHHSWGAFPNATPAPALGRARCSLLCAPQCAILCGGRSLQQPRLHNSSRIRMMWIWDMTLPAVWSWAVDYTVELPFSHLYSEMYCEEKQW